MNNHILGRLPTTKNKSGERVRSDNALVYEVSAILRGAMQRHKRYLISGGFRIDVGWLKRHLDDDDLLTRRVLLNSGFCLDKDGDWVHRGGAWKLENVVDMVALGDLIADLVDIHRPL